MLMARLKPVVVLVLVASVFGTGVALFKDRAWADEKPAKKASPVQPQAQNRKKLNVLLKERRAFAKEQCEVWTRKAIGYLEDAASRRRPRGRAANVLDPDGEKANNLQLELNPLRVSDAQVHLYQWAQRLLTAELDLSDKQADRVAAYEAHVLRMKEVEDDFNKRVEKGNVYAAEATFHRLEAEIMLEREMVH